jgi:hypothetical protein
MPSIDFPNSPTVGQQFTSGGKVWEWTGAVWNSVSEIVTGPEGPQGPQGPDGKFYVSTTAPASPTDGDAWFNSETGRMFIRYDSYWIETGVSVAGANGATGPSGVVAATAPITYNSSTQTVGINQSGLTLEQSQITGLSTSLSGKVNTVNGTVTTASTSSTVVRNITLSTSDPSGGTDGDVWLKYTA